MIQDLKNINIDHNDDFNKDNTLFLDPNLDFKNTTGNNLFFGSDGYIEEEDDDQFTPEEEEILGVKPKLKIPENLTSIDQLKAVLMSNKFENQKFKIKLLHIKFEEEEFYVINPEFMFVILKYLYEELNDPMLEFSDNCAEDRRKFFETNFSNYIKTIELYLKKKNEFFSCVLSSLFFKLSINQQDFDNSVNYYINQAEDSEKIIKIRDQYEQVFNVGKKEMYIVMLKKEKLSRKFLLRIS